MKLVSLIKVNLEKHADKAVANPYGSKRWNILVGSVHHLTGIYHQI